MKINKYFPVLKPGYVVDFIDCNDKVCKKATVSRVWYPKEGDTWNETDECKHLGYLCSASEDIFPQVLLNTKHIGGLYIMTGDDAERILNIYYRGKLLKKTLHYIIKSK
jgi:hypothetical protein